MNKRLFGQRQRRLLLLAMCAVGLLFPLSGNAGVAASEQSSQTASTHSRLTTERLTVPYALGTTGVQTVNSYSGRIQVKVSGAGQASGLQWSDAFYVFTDLQGNPVEPFRYTDYYNYTLWVNGVSVDVFMNRIPAYNPNHSYTFQINVPTGPLTFAVGDPYWIDNTGEYQITVKDLPH